MIIAHISVLLNYVKGLVTMDLRDNFLNILKLLLAVESDFTKWL
jgi:hypothetical protein